MPEGNDWEEIGKFKFEYQELREEITRSTNMDYVIMSIFVVASLLIIGNAYTVYYDNFYSNSTNCTNSTQTPTVGLQEKQIPVLLGPCFFSLFLLLSAFFIDKRFTAFNKIKGCRMFYLEKKLGIYNIRLTTKVNDKRNELISINQCDGEYKVYDTENCFEGVKEVNKGLKSNKIFLKIRVSDYFLILIVMVSIGWAFLLPEGWKKLPFIILLIIPFITFFPSLITRIKKIDC